MARSVSSRPGRSLGVLVGIIAVIFGVIGAGVVWSNAQWTPKLALDLEGGTEIVLTAVPQPGTSGTITQQTLDEAVKIIRQRINGSGVSEAEITTQGGRNIVVSLPGKTDEATRDSVKRAAALEFRAVLVEQPTQVPESPSPTSSASPSSSTTTGPRPSGSAKAGASPSSTIRAPKASGPASPSAPTKPSATVSSNGMAVPKALLAATTPASPTTGGTSSASPSATAKPSSGASASPSAAKPTDASDMAWIDEAIAKKFTELDCAKKENRTGQVVDDLTKPLVTCSKAGDAKYILGPAEVTGKDIKSASAGLETTRQGAVGTTWEVNLEFKSEGSAKFATVSKRLTALEQPRNQFAIVLDGLVVSAPRTNEAITGGQAQITGDFDQEEAQGLANQLKFGALPISFQEQTEQNISATLGGEQLQRGLLAGLIGLGLVVLYSLLQYRALGTVTIASLAIAAVVTYGLVVLLGWRQGYRLSLPGVVGLIVAIGITADSFIVYFERVRDEVRDGRGLQAAVETAWIRARRTILISDAVSFLAAVVLWLLAVGGVQGFAFTLGLTTLVDLLVVFLFTHPIVVLVARTKFFGGGHRLSGFDAAHLGRAVSYTGRGGIRNQPRRGSRPAARATSSAAAAARGGTEPVKISADEDSFTGSSSSSSSGTVRTGTTIAERRAAAERAQREALVREPGGGGHDSGDELADDVRNGRRDA